MRIVMGPTAGTEVAPCDRSRPTSSIAEACQPYWPVTRIPL
jgi:hypothetical protein